jgi:predicted choloylglycine hydrolase
MKSLIFILLCAQAWSAPLCKMIKQTHNLTLQKCDSLSLLWLKGTPVERARAHGELLGQELTLDNLNLFLALPLRGLQKETLKYKLLDTVLNWAVRWAGSDAPVSYFEETQAMAIAAHQTPLSLRRAIWLPDFGAYSWALLSGQGKNLSPQGCTSAVYSPSSGAFIQGRNLDFPGSPAFDKNLLLVVHIPEKGSRELKHVAIGTHGLQFSGITGFNEAGITFAVHQNYTRSLSLKGVPMPYIGELVLRQAKNLDEAVDIIKKNPPGPLWTFVLSDLKTSEALTVEVSNNNFKVRKKSRPLFAQTNHLMASSEKELSLVDAGTRFNSPFRMQKALDLMKIWRKPEAKKMAELLAWQKDRMNFSPIMDILKVLTIQSVIYEKENKNSPIKFYVTLDNSPAPTGRWGQFDYNSFFTKPSMTDSDFKIFDFLKTEPSIRDLQKKWSAVYSSQIVQNFKKALELITPLVQSPDSYLAKSVLELKLERPLDSLVSSQKGLKQSLVSTPQLVTQGLQWMKIISLYHLKKMVLVKNEALSLKNQGILDPELAIQVQSLLENRTPSEASLEPDFDFFGGYLLGMPSRPKD